VEFYRFIQNSTGRVSSRARKATHVTAAVKDAAAPGRYEAVFLMKPGVEDSLRAAEVDKLRSMFETGGATEFEVTDRGVVQNAYEIKGFADSHQYMINVQCPRGTVKTVQDALAMPVIGAEEIILRYMFFKE
jgi:ribosomal protein S6